MPAASPVEALPVEALPVETLPYRGACARARAEGGGRGPAPPSSHIHHTCPQILYFFHLG